MTPYIYQNYRLYIRAAIENAKRSGADLNYSRLAKSIGVQKSYLSQVLAGKCHLNSDQLFKAAMTLKLTTDECEFLVLLLELEKTSIVERRELLQGKRDELSKHRQAS